MSCNDGLRVSTRISGQIEGERGDNGVPLPIFEGATPHAPSSDGRLRVTQKLTTLDAVKY